MTTIVTKYGIAYNNPLGIDEEKYYELLYEFEDLAKAKGLTVRQAQKLFTDCADMVLESRL